MYQSRKFVRVPLSPSEIKKIPFKEVCPLRLKNEVSGKGGGKGADVTCLQEMAVMFACMKKHDFKEVKCAQEITIFNKCYTEHTQTKKLQKEREKSGHQVTGTNVRNINTKQLNQLLKKYPQYNDKL